MHICCDQFYGKLFFYVMSKKDTIMLSFRCENLDSNNSETVTCDWHLTPCFNDCEKINSFHHISFLCDLLTKLTHLTKLTMSLIYMIYTVERVNTKKGIKALIII